MKDLSRWPVDRYVNIWVVGRIQLGVLGYAWLPSMLVGILSTVVPTGWCYQPK